MKIKLALPVYVASAVLLSQGTYAEGWGITASIGQADYEFEVQEVYEGEEPYEQKINGDFFSRDIGVDYSWGNHQVAFKVGGLAEEDNVVDSTEAFGVESYTEQGDVKRDDFQLSYTYRFDNGVSVVAGYYSSDTTLNYTNSYSNPDYFNDGGSESTSAAGTRQKELENDGYFVGLAYGFSITERIGAYVKGGYQVASLESTVQGEDVFVAEWANNFRQGSEFSRQYKSDSTALTAGFGLFYGINESWVASLNYDVKSFDYDESSYNSVGTYAVSADGQETITADIDFSEGDSVPIKFDETQSTISLSLRYVF